MVHVPVGPFAAFNSIGGDDPNVGEFMTLLGKDGYYAYDVNNAKLLKSIEVWYDDESLTSLQLTWADGTQSNTYGSQSDQGYRADGQSKKFEHTFQYSKGEKITKMRLWGNGQGQFCGAMRFDTQLPNQDAVTYTVNESKASGDGYKTDVGCGVLVGFCGRSGWRLDVLCCVFLAGDVQNLVIHDIQPRNPNWADSPTGDMSLRGIEVSTSSSSPTSWSLANLKKTTNTWTYTSTMTNTVGASATVKGTFGIAEASATAKWEIAIQSSSTTGGSEEINLNTTFTGTTPAGLKQRIEAVCSWGTMNDLPYTSKLDFIWWDGQNEQTITFEDWGEFSGVMYTEARVKTIDL